MAAKTQNQQIKELLITSLTKFKFDKCVTQQTLKESFKGIAKYNKEHDYLWEKRHGYVLDNKSRVLMETAIKQVYNKNINYNFFKSKTINELYSAICYYENEYISNHGYTYGMGILWCGENEFEQAQNMIDTNSNKELKQLITSGRIVYKLKKDFPNADIINYESCQNYCYYMYKTNTSCYITIYGNYMLKLGCICFKSQDNLENKRDASFILNENLVLILKNEKTGKSIKVNNYSDIKRTLQRAN